MTDQLSPEQSAALVAALDDPSTLWHCLQPAIEFRSMGLAEWEGEGTDMCRTVLTPAGRIIAQQCKQRELDIGTQCALLSQLDEVEQELEILRDQQPYWRPIAECTEPETGWYFLRCTSNLPGGYSTGRVLYFQPGDRWSKDGYRVDQFCGPIPFPVTVPDAPESEGS